MLNVGESMCTASAATLDSSTPPISELPKIGFSKTGVLFSASLTVGIRGSTIVTRGAYAGASRNLTLLRVSDRVLLNRHIHHTYTSYIAKTVAQSSQRPLERRRPLLRRHHGGIFLHGVTENVMTKRVEYQPNFRNSLMKIV